MATKRQEKKREIARAAVIPFSRMGVRNVRLSDIGDECGMTAATLLYYFGTKTDLFMDSLRIVEADFRELADNAFSSISSARERWQWLLIEGAPTGVRDSALLLWLEAWSVAVHEPEIKSMLADLENDWQQLLLDVLSLGQSQGELSSDLNLNEFVKAFAALQDGLTIRVVVDYQQMDSEEYVSILKKFSDDQLRWTSQ